MICTATAGVALLSRQKCPKATWGNPQDPDAPERPPGKPKGGFPERRLNGAYKVPQAHLPPPNLPRFGGGERPPFCCKPPAPLTITMGQRLTVFASPNIPRAPNCRPALASPSGPLSRIGKGAGGKGQMRCGYLGSDSVRSTDLDFSWEKNLNPYPALQATGVLGQSPKRVLVPFTRVKGTPRRRAVLTKFSKRLAPPEVIADFFTNTPPIGDCKPAPAGQAYQLGLVKGFPHRR